MTYEPCVFSPWARVGVEGSKASQEGTDLSRKASKCPCRASPHPPPPPSRRRSVHTPPATNAVRSPASAPDHPGLGRELEDRLLCPREIATQADAHASFQRRTATATADRPSSRR